MLAVRICQCLFVRRAIQTDTLLLVKIGEQRQVTTTMRRTPDKNLAFRAFPVPLGGATGAVSPESLPD